MRLPHVLPTAAVGALLLLSACGSDGDPDPVVLTGNRVTTTTDTTVPETDPAASEETAADDEAPQDGEPADGETPQDGEPADGEAPQDGTQGEATDEVPDEGGLGAGDEGPEAGGSETPEDAVDEALPQDVAGPETDAGDAVDGAGP